MLVVVVCFGVKCEEKRSRDARIFLRGTSRALTIHGLVSSCGASSTRPSLRLRPTLLHRRLVIKHQSLQPCIHVAQLHLTDKRRITILVQTPESLPREPGSMANDALLAHQTSSMTRAREPVLQDQPLHRLRIPRLVSIGPALKSW